jgi:hypothetical protein
VTIEELADEIEAATRRFRFIRSVVKLDATRFSFKYRLTVTAELYVQVYANVRNGTVGMALIYQGRRLYGRDSQDGLWHRHPADDPVAHDFSPEGTRAVTVEEFLFETEEILVDQGLI